MFLLGNLPAVCSPMGSGTRTLCFGTEALTVCLYKRVERKCRRVVTGCARNSRRKGYCIVCRSRDEDKRGYVETEPFWSLGRWLIVLLLCRMTTCQSFFRPLTVMCNYLVPWTVFVDINVRLWGVLIRRKCSSPVGPNPGTSHFVQL